MSACLYIEKSDGSVEVLKTGDVRKAELNAAGDWQSPRFSDATWPAAVPADVEEGHGRPAR
jgi:hypothetical protein